LQSSSALAPTQSCTPTWPQQPEELWLQAFERRGHRSIKPSMHGDAGQKQHWEVGETDSWFIEPKLSSAWMRGC